MKLDENLASIHSYFCSDGYVIKNLKRKCYSMGFRNQNLKLLKDFQKKFKKYFGKSPKLVEGERCYVYSKEIYSRLTEKFGSFYSRDWTMLKLNKQLSLIWLRTFFDCEGWVYCKSHQNRHIGLDSINEKGLDQIRNKLASLGIKTIKKINSKRKIFRILIYGKENLIKFERKIGFLHPAKSKKLKLAIEDFVNYYWDFPSKDEKRKKFIKRILKEKGKIRKNCYTLRIISNKRINLLNLKKNMYNFFKIRSKLYKRKNGLGTIYFELALNKKEITKLINLKILPKVLKCTKKN